jgi:phenylacetate-CoA ligase
LIVGRIASVVEPILRKSGGFTANVNKPFLSNFIKKHLPEYKWIKFKKTIKYAYENVPYYKKTFREAGLRPEDIKTPDEIKKIPFTYSKDIQENPKEFFAVPETNFVRVSTTAGTTGEPKRIYFTKNDVESIVDSIAMGMKIFYKMDYRDVVRLIIETGYGLEIWGGRYWCERAIEKIGAMHISFGRRLPPELEIKVLDIYRPTAVVCTPSYFNYLTDKIRKERDPKEWGIRRVFSSAEPLPSYVRKKIEKVWDTSVYNSYGLTEISISLAAECEKKDGMHIDETAAYAEVIDPETGEQLEEGETGELVFTTLTREGMPLIRYRSRDLGSLIYETCECGLPFQRIAKISSRTDDMFTIGTGDNVFPEMFDNALLGLPEVVEYQILLDRKRGKDYFTVTVETNEINEKTRKKVLDALLNIVELYDGVYNSKTIAKPKIKLVKVGTFDRNKIKMKRIIDKRNLYE